MIVSAYQDESPGETEKVEKRREPFRDIEAQRIRDDVTIQVRSRFAFLAPLAPISVPPILSILALRLQIFNEPFVKEFSDTGCESPSCFVVRARRKVRARLKKRPGADCDSSSIADTESWSTEEVDEEEVIHIEVDDDSEELLPKCKKKQGRINKIVAAVARIPWLGKRKVQTKSPLFLEIFVPLLISLEIRLLQK